ncbi:tyrosine-type recombinase/integrase [Rossellomorea aquimaris]|uniref:tyrosine-type recombinase/integrase n=1 Tax=Rossellomorea aquimaris TaxID=189382 RepID=UPI0007D0986F|nr:tyrosine-type recombinase/integrase [Rossellomorea aquimaris]
MKSRWAPRLPQPVPKYVEKRGIAKVRIQTEKKILRDQLLFEFLLSSGCRVAEAQQLDIDDVNLEYRTARITGKGEKIRQVHFTERCAYLFEKYLESHPKNVKAVFISSKGKRLSKRRIQIIINEIGEEAGVTPRLYPHKLRHTFATELLAKGADLSFIGGELGHSDIATTRIYARLPKKEIISMYRKFMG